MPKMHEREASPALLPPLPSRGRGSKVRINTADETGEIKFRNGRNTVDKPQIQLITTANADACKGSASAFEARKESTGYVTARSCIGRICSGQELLRKNLADEIGEILFRSGRNTESPQDRNC